ncbi:uncharacterized protein STEHIDRAFT_171684, partial [Stereum hirsutum FP-91666 SS1]|uniref:uncharacterized protein n=1 Tax=Stereum hirsutum (strain FP-91666) TaxID=721885 RepID=UPI00044494B3
MNSLAWNSLPHEMQLAVLDAFPPAALNAFSRTCKSAHAFAVPAMFSSVTLPSFSALVQFLDNVPEAYWSHIRALDISTKFESAIPPSAGATPRTDALVRLLSRSLRLERLTLRLSGGLASHVIHCFPHLRSLRHLEIENCDDEEVSPLSEDIIVSIASSIPALSTLRLTRITRSVQHAPDLYPCPRSRSSSLTTSSYIASVPLVATNFGSLSETTSLPYLLSIPTLKHLSIRNTHLGDPTWSSPFLPITCSLESLELGAHPDVSPSQNSTFTHSILRRLSISPSAPSLRHITFHAGLDNSNDNSAITLPSLSSVHFTPLVIPETIQPSLDAFATSPLSKITLECLKDDLIDMCEELTRYVESLKDREVTSCLMVVAVKVVKSLEGDVLAREIEADEGLDEDTREAVDGLVAACVDVSIISSVDGI